MVHRQALTGFHGRVHYRVGSVRQVPHVPVPAEPAGQEQDTNIRLPKEELAGETGLVFLYVIVVFMCYFVKNSIFVINIQN